MMLAQGSDAGGSTSGGAGGAGAGGAAGERSVWESAGDVYKLYIIQVCGLIGLEWAGDWLGVRWVGCDGEGSWAGGGCGRVVFVVFVFECV